MTSSNMILPETQPELECTDEPIFKAATEKTQPTYKGVLFKSKSPLALIALLKNTACGEQTQAEAIIESRPELLFESGKATDLSFNTFNEFSPVEIACYTHDLDMLKMMKPYADKIEGGAEKFIAILKKANGYEAKKQDVYDFSELISAITDSSNVKKEQALKQFRQTFGPRVIENHEKSFNIKNLCKAYEIFLSYFDQWTDDQTALFWCKVIGFLQRMLPVCYAQAYCTGLYNRHGYDETCRTLKLDNGKSLVRDDRWDFYPDYLSSDAGLGFHYGLYIGDPDKAGRPIPRSRPGRLCGGGRLEAFVKERRQYLESLCFEQTPVKSIIHQSCPARALASD